MGTGRGLCVTIDKGEGRLEGGAPTIAMGEDIIAGVVIILLAALVWLVIRRQPSAAERYEGMADRCAEKIDKLSTRLDAAECEIGNLKRDLAGRDRLINEWYEGILALMHQTKAAGLAPAWSPSKPKAWYREVEAEDLQG